MSWNNSDELTQVTDVAILGACSFLRVSLWKKFQRVENRYIAVYLCIFILEPTDVSCSFSFSNDEKKKNENDRNIFFF